jgi:hypothetical protein
MFRRIAAVLVAVLALGVGRAEAVTIRDVIELSKAGLSEQVLLALIEVDGRVFTIDTPALKQLKEAGVTDGVIVALIRSGRTPRAQEPEQAPEPAAPASEPDVIVRYVDRYIDRYRDAYPPPAPAPAPVAVPYPVAVPVYVPLPTTRRSSGQRAVTATVQTDIGLVTARVPVPPNCVKAEPVYWGFGGKLRPDAWQPPPTVVCGR